MCTQKFLNVRYQYILRNLPHIPAIPLPLLHRILFGFWYHFPLEIFPVFLVHQKHQQMGLCFPWRLFHNCHLCCPWLWHCFHPSPEWNLDHTVLQQLVEENWHPTTGVSLHYLNFGRYRNIICHGNDDCDNPGDKYSYHEGVHCSWPTVGSEVHSHFPFSLKNQWQMLLR